MNDVDYKNWANEIWGGQLFGYTSTVEGARTIVTRLRATTAQVQGLAPGGSWQRMDYGTVADQLVPTITWLTLVVSQSMLVEVSQRNSPVLRILIKTDASRTSDGTIKLSESQRSYMMTERIATLLACSTLLAATLHNSVRDELSLQIIEFASVLLKKCGQAHAKHALFRLWGCPPEQIRSVIPPRFHPLANTDRPLKIWKDLERCIDLMASWKPHE